MTNYSQELSHTTTIRARVAFALAIADRVVQTLQSNGNPFIVAQQALNGGWQWEQDGTIHVDELYKNNVKELASQSSQLADAAQDVAMNTVISAFYYIMWHAYYQDLANGLINEGDIPNDLMEVSEDVLQEVCDFATQTTMCDVSWLVATSNRLVSDYRTENPDELGRPVPRTYFSSASHTNHS